MKLIYIEMDSLPCQLPIISKTRILLTNKVLQARGFPPASTAWLATLRCAFLIPKEKGIAIIFFSDLPAATPENVSKKIRRKKKKKMQPRILSNFPSWSGFWGVCNSEKSAPQWSELWSLLWETNYNAACSTYHPCFSNKNHSLLASIC